MRHIITVLFILSVNAGLPAQQIPLPADLPQGHPRLLTTDSYKQALQQQIKNEAWAKDVYQGIMDRISPYVEKTQKEPDWMLSRLMMYWKSHATDVYINGGVYSHAGGQAPVPTVRFGSTRGVHSHYKRPELENIVPYMDDTKGVCFLNTAKDGSSPEWVEQGSVSGGNIESVNTEIIRLGRDGAFVFWLTGDKKYGRFAYDILDTYLTGLYYRNEPVDIGKGHAQTLAGLTTFEVIQEAVYHDLALYYDFLYNYIKSEHKDKAALYEAALKKGIDVTIKNGVPHNNWNLHQANIILSVAMVLDDNRNYTDGKGREYYIDYVLNKTSSRQWSLPELMQYGYDCDNGVWNECPGYASSVTREFMRFINNYDNTFGQDILPYMPVMYKAVEVLPQYLFPNGKITAFGDTYYSGLDTGPVLDMIRIAQKHRKTEDEIRFTGMYKLFSPGAGAEAQNRKTSKLPAEVSSFFTAKPLVLDRNTAKAKLPDYVTQTFYAPNVSWFVQRNKYDSKENGLMISQYASFGNHAHSNGIAMELYGKGYILGAESGIGSSYFEKPYLEYYSQFPAHNTVMVDGISKYPEMSGNHPFDLLACYPRPMQKDGFYKGITYSDIYFLEPESRSDQSRLLSIVSTGEKTGYYVDIFRSRKQRKGDKFHDYFYHNLGQELIIRDTKGQSLDLRQSDEMAFAGRHLFALDYMWDKKSAKTNDDYQAVWKMSFPDGNHIYMNLWMQGQDGREVFSIKAPACKAFRNNNDFPYEVNKAPYLTIAARQHGEAWNSPFVSVFEPTTEEGKSIQAIESFNVPDASPDFVGLTVKSKPGRTDYIFSSAKDEKVSYREMSANATYAVVSENGKNFTLFLGNGTFVQGKGCSILADERTNAVLEYENGEYYLMTESPVTVKAGRKTIKFNKMTYRKIKL